MNTGQDRRDNPRKKVNLPVKIVVKGQVAAVGHVMDISYYGVKIVILLKISKGKATLKELMSVKEAVLEIGEPGGNTLHIVASAGVKWNTYSCGETEEIYMAGLELMLSGPGKEQWKQNYENI